ncbi:MAG: hypothetical protein GY847_00355 [Proteobacteria bacterium]|nr:hypothetical protein [Pseudomonadota bacterium]
MLSLFRFNMIHLNPNSSSPQSIYLTLSEMRKDFAVFTNYLVLFQSMASKEDFYFIGYVDTDNARYTTLQVYTNEDSRTGGKVLLTESGLYTYKVWGQNSSTNLNPTNDAVVALLEQGTLNVAGATGYDIPDITIPDNIIYYQ